VAAWAALVIVATQLWLVLSGNFSWLNWITVVLALSAFPDAWLRRVFGFVVPAHVAVPGPLWHVAVVLLVSALVAALSWWPVRNMMSPGQAMNASFNSLHLVNTYGAFGTVTRVRNEVVIEGTRDAVLSDATRWVEYEFKGKPGDLRRLPPQVAPYHLRLDWLMWFAALSPGYARGWFAMLLVRLLENDRATLRLLRGNPFPDEPPRYVRALLYRYRFSTWAERRATGEWWVRRLVGEYAAPIGLHR
jgi:hypothetical protein